MTNTGDLIQITTTYTGITHIAASFPGGHSNTALCGVPLIGRIRWVNIKSNCTKCQAAR